MDQQLVERLTCLRRDLHRIPEVDFDLPATLAYVRGVLEPLAARMAARGCRVEVFSPARSAVCAFFDRGTPTATAIRSDMDALPVTERTGRPFASTHAGKMHACGHDGHMAMVLALAEQLEQRFDDLDESVLLVFQPAEETTGGARLIAESGVFERLHVRRIFGFHLWPDLDKGVVASRPGALLAASNETTVTFAGKASHIAKAEQGCDSLEAGCRFLTRAYDYIERRRVEEPFLLKFGRMQSGEVRNQISARTVLEGSLRTFSLQMRDSCQADLQVIAHRCAGETGCTTEVAYSAGYPPVVNDVEVFAQAQQALPYLQAIPEPLLISEDFSWYQQHLPGVFLLLGTGTGIPLHADTFDFDEAILERGVETYLRLLGLHCGH
jgi:hippurate hydrolase